LNAKLLLESSDHQLAGRPQLIPVESEQKIPLLLKRGALRDIHFYGLVSQTAPTIISIAWAAPSGFRQC
jgi:hypothetical protein